MSKTWHDKFLTLDGGKAAEAFLRGFGSSVIYGVGPILIKVLGSITRQVGGTDH